VAKCKKKENIFLFFKVLFGKKLFFCNKIAQNIPEMFARHIPK
jgi:hypothetical protein